MLINQEKTSLFNVDEFDEEVVRRIITDVRDALEDRDYDVVSQLVGYLVSADPGYISSHLEARKKITSIDRCTILEVILREYLKKLD